MRTQRTRASGQLANDAWEALLVAHTTLIKRFAAQDVWQDLSMREYDVLYTLAKCGDPMRLGELNRQVLLSQPALSRMVERLVARGLLRRTSDEADARSVLLALTQAGREEQRRVGGRHAAGVAAAMRTLTADELHQLESLCQKLTADPGQIGQSIR